MMSGTSVNNAHNPAGASMFIGPKASGIASLSIRFAVTIYKGYGHQLEYIL
jgi:hypothetical protein